MRIKPDTIVTDVIDSHERRLRFLELVLHASVAGFAIQRAIRLTANFFEQVKHLDE